MRGEQLAAKRKTVKPWVKIVIAVLALALLVVLGLRLGGWLQQGQPSAPQRDCGMICTVMSCAVHAVDMLNNDRRREIGVN